MQCAGGAAMTDPITPPPELVHQWSDITPMEDAVVQNWVKIATQAAQWGWDQRGAANEVELQQRADQELEACVQLMPSDSMEKYLRTARRPKPPSLKEQALGAVGRFTVNAHTNANEMNRDFDTIRRALEQLND